MFAKNIQRFFPILIIVALMLFSCVAKNDIFQLRLVHPENDKLVKDKIQHDLSNYEKFIEKKGDKSVPIWVSKNIELDISDLQSSSIKFTKPIYVKITPAIKEKLRETLSDYEIEQFGDGFNMGGDWQLNLAFNPKGTKKLEVFTKAHSGKRIVILLDGKVLASPVIARPIKDGKAQIHGPFTKEEFESISNRLNRSISQKKL